ncbi:peptidylprolyl isomerase [Lutispora thermophila]|uniref:peptidylprolyl isomerase n=1 Tax=Lutispora thermophila DSM 19022 TaxID=1122184 RepID=A0A1M6GEL6_9FIRM|nr:peptidylprolyl isomerase [Lutispora thermophila]SHJ08368.1 foldase protein PrsA [Lutispora thermophila DSM 19022]
MNYRRVWIAGILIMTLGTFVAAGCEMVRVKPGDPETTVVAKVDGEEITKAEFDKVFEIFKTQVELEQDPSIWEKQYEGKKYEDLAKEKVLDQLISDKVQMKKAQEMGITVTDEEIDAEVDKWKKLFNSDEKYIEFLTSLNIDEEYFRDNLKKDLVKNKMKEELTKNVEIADEELADYYGRHINEFYKVKASHILLDTEEEARKILERVKAGEDFNALAKEYSTDPSAKQNSGSLGYFRQGDMVESFEQAAFALKPGEISDIVKSEYGYHIIKVEEKSIDKFEDVKNELRNALITEKKSKSYDEALEEMMSNVKIEKFPENL